MRRFLVIWSREMAGCFLSPVAYVTMVVFLAVSGLTCMYIVYGNNGSDEPLTSLLFVSILLWLPVLITVISMRLFTEEMRSGTIETLMTAPVTERQVVLGKYAGALTFMVVVSAPAVAYIFILNWLSPGIRTADIDMGALSGGCIIMLLVAALCVAIGLFVSLLTRNQIVAAICTFCSIWFVLLLGYLVTFLPLELDKAGDYISCLNHIENFSRGIIDGRQVVLYLSAICLILFSSVRVLEMKHWR